MIMNDQRRLLATRRRVAPHERKYSMKSLGIQCLLCLSVFVSQISMADPKADSETLLNAAVPFAEKMLKEHAEFNPYAFTLRADGTTAMVAGYDGRENQNSAETIRLLKDWLKADAAAHKIVASAIVSDVVTTDPRTGVMDNAISVALDHKDQYSVVVLLRYTLRGSSLTMAAPTAQKGASDIF